MAIVQNPFIGRARKSAGGMRMSTWRGLNILAAKPMEVRQNVTPAVELNRSKMAVVGQFVGRFSQFTKEAYSLGISKTTPFADTVKFFRSKMLDTLKLDVNLLKGASFGTGNTSVGDFANLASDISCFEIEFNFDSAVWGVEPIDFNFFIFNDSMSKVVVIKSQNTPAGTVSFDLGDQGFVVGDKIYFGVKPVKFRPGADLSGKVKMCNSNTFITLA